jgi:hypothetical protein
MNTRFKVFASFNILLYLCDFIHVLIFVTISKCRKSPKLTNIVIGPHVRFVPPNLDVRTSLARSKQTKVHHLPPSTQLHAHTGYTWIDRKKLKIRKKVQLFKKTERPLVDDTLSILLNSENAS